MAASCISLAVSSGSLATVSTRTDCALSKRPSSLAGAPSIAVTTSDASLCLSRLALTLGLPTQRRASRCAAFAASSDLEQDVYGEGDQQSFAPPPPPEQGSKLYVGNLPWDVDSRMLAEVFQDVGTVEQVEVIYDRDTGRSRGFGFVTMGSHEDACAAIERLDGSDLGQRSIRVNFPQPTNRLGGPRPDGFGGPRPGGFGMGGGFNNSPFKLFVGNLAWSVDDGGLEELFSRHGRVLESRVIYDRATGKSKGFGFVTLSAQNEVDDAISQLNGYNLDGRELRVNPAGDKPPPRMEF
eukprot:TRINITY_DN6197_c0_g1_i1.p1 TRINITY_DN6197_c0_g1~~TRINITY_DN6197_c0_g1_i1.p1  ORF type:complete len:296 (-),score=27.38 TRINITY_DN6197_c0_g1_i1:488-1375(-)